MSVTYVCECCGEPITREEYDSQGFIAYCQTCKKMPPQKEKTKSTKSMGSKTSIKGSK